MSHPRQNCTCKCALYTVTSVELGCMKSCRITGSLLWFNRMPLFQMPEELSSWSTNIPFCCKKCSFCFNSILFCPEYHPEPLFFTQLSHPFWGYVLIMYIHKTSPTPPQNTPLPGLNSKVGKMNYNRATWTPTGQYVWNTDKKFLEVDKKLIHGSGHLGKEVDWSPDFHCAISDALKIGVLSSDRNPDVLVAACKFWNIHLLVKMGFKWTLWVSEHIGGSLWLSEQVS